LIERRELQLMCGVGDHVMQALRAMRSHQ
jgi:hypothetical protein